ncbi:interferon-induced transmembrane protein 5-like [Xenopus laevis]|uniref:Interferon-induced transmembrane protein 5-like n=1 Tax=Xenopus laevis TaxID=8355 RepID=A0A8J1KHH6_XENLA|nr:interferon-induced transmembrane protein 5-like [Xenopus laevis]XP_041416818.1 interferon-induced transmembrane protein 5-like [Xenopus laevis]
MDTHYPREEEIIQKEPKKTDSPSTIITMGAPAPIRDHLIWSLCNTLYLNLFCLGFIALIYSIKVRDQKVQGNEQAARRYAKKAHCYNMLATVWNFTVPALLLAALIIGIVHLSQVVSGIIDFFGLRGDSDDDEK